MPEARTAAQGDLIVHTPPGTPPEAMARALAAALAETGAGRAWQVVHRAGGHGEEAMRALIDGRGRADLLATCTPSFLQTPLMESLPFTYRDLTPLARLVSDRYLLVVRPDSDLEAATFGAKTKGERTRSGGYMTGSINQLVGVAIEEAYGASVEYILVKSAAELVPALRDGRLDWIIATTGEVRGAVEEGSLRAIAVVAKERLKTFPDVPALSELGVEVDVSLWRGVMGPPGLATEATSEWDRALRAAIASSAWSDYEGKSGVTTDYLGGPDFARLLEREEAWYAAQLRRAELLRAQA